MKPVLLFLKSSVKTRLQLEDSSKRIVSFLVKLTVCVYVSLWPYVCCRLRNYWTNRATILQGDTSPAWECYSLCHLPLQPQVGLQQQEEVHLEQQGYILKRSLLNKNCRTPLTLVGWIQVTYTTKPGWTPAGRCAQKASGAMWVHLKEKFTRQKP